MSTIKECRDNLPTLPYVEAIDESAKKTLNCRETDYGASQARMLTDQDVATRANPCKEQSEDEASMPEFSPAFVKIPFEDIELGDCCGEGSFGTVYIGKWLSQNKAVAVKTLNRMDEEVRILSTLSHRNIIQFYGACCEIPNCCLVTEYAPYGSLYGFLSSPKSENLEYNQMLTWARDVALGMNYLHEEAPIQVVHRDLKSKNVLICNDFCLKICDFGASRVFDETTVMTITGTYPWMAPELIQGLPTSELCDVYSFGVVLWELLTKEVPFKGLQGFQVAWNVVEKKERPLIPTTCPKQLSNLMQKCWHADSLQRPPFCDILVDLNQMLSDTELEKETDSFVHTKGDWIMEVKDKLKDIRQQESKLEAEKNNVEEREKIMKEWAERLENELKQKSLFQFSTSFNCEYSETRTSTSNMKDTVNRMMFSSGLHRHSREEKFGMRMEASSPGTAASPLFGVPLSRQGSTSSMESSRSMSIQSDMTYDLSKVNVDSSPVSFMDSSGTEGFPFPKVRDMQGSSRSRMKLQKQMSASSEEIQYEGLKMSRDGTPSNGEMRNMSEWEKSTSKSKTNVMNESLSMSSDNFVDCSSKSSCSGSDKMVIPSVDILEKAFLGINLNKLPAVDTQTIAAKLYNSLEIILRDAKKSSSPSPTDEIDCNGARNGINQLARKSSPSGKSIPPLSISQKPPISYSPSRVMEIDDPCSTVRQRPRKGTTKTVETQTDCSSSTIAKKEFGTQTLTSNGKNSENYFNHTPSIERACTDAHKSGAREYITLRISRNSPLESFQPISEKDEDLGDAISGQVHNNAAIRQNVMINGPSAVPQKVGVVTRPLPPKSLSLDQASPPKNNSSEMPRHIAARHVYLSGRSSSAMEQSNIYETDDFTYIIRPNRRRR